MSATDPVVVKEGAEQLVLLTEPLPEMASVSTTSPMQVDPAIVPAPLMLRSELGR